MHLYLNYVGSLSERPFFIALMIYFPQQMKRKIFAEKEGEKNDYQYL